MRIFLGATATLFILLGAGLPAAAQELLPLGQVLETSAPPYPLSRCAGLFQAVIEWAGEKKLGPTLYNQYEQEVKSLVVVSTMIAMQNGATGDERLVLRGTVQDVGAIRDLYEARFRKNYVASGDAFATDTLVLSDLEVCKKVREIATGKSN